MKGKERVFTALNNKKPDRIPHFEWSISNSVIQKANVWPKFGWSYENFVDLLDLDAVVAWPLYETKIFNDNTVKDEANIIRKKTIGDYATPIDKSNPIRTRKDLSKYQFPDINNPTRWIQLNCLRKSFKDEKAIIMKLRDVFSWPRELLGYENLMLNIAENKKFVWEIVNRCVDYSKKMASIAVDKGAEIIFTGDDIAYNKGLLISPKDYKKIFLPGYKELVQHFKELGVYVIKHSDGNITSILDDLIEAGIDAIDPIDCSAMNLKKIKNKYGDRIAIKGNVNCSKVLEGPDKNKVVEETIRCIIEGGPGGGYILSSDNSVHSGVTYSNYKLMVETLKEHGCYPLNFKKLKEKYPIK